MTISRGTILSALCLCLLAANLPGADQPKGAGPRAVAPDRSVLSTEQWRKLDRAIDRGLAFIASQQRPDGSFPTSAEGQPGVTSLCVMAFLARGHQPGKGPYGSRIERAIDYVLDMQHPVVGSLMSDQWVGPDFTVVRRITDGMPRSFAGNYNHGIAGLMLGEVYGTTNPTQNQRVRAAILKALEYTRKQQTRPKRTPDDRGGWRYVHYYAVNDSDLSVTAWQLMFLRSARNAEFNVPAEWIKEAMGYVHRSFDSEQKGFVYALSGADRYCSRGMVGAGIVCLSMGGEHESKTAKLAGDWILRSSFANYNRISFPDDRYHYGAFYCSQAMFQLGGDYWRRFFPDFMTVLTANQHEDGSWDAESTDDDVYGNSYTTALMVLSLATPYQLLPIYQR